MDLVKSNFENLTSLWETVGKKVNAFHKEKDFSYCEVNYSEWPNRLWFHKKVNEKSLDKAKDILLRAEVAMKISHMEIDSFERKWFEEKGFTVVSKLIGMSLLLDKRYETENRISLRDVIDKDEAALWSELFERAFNYQINDKLVLLSCNDVGYYIAYNNKQPVGTCILYNHSNDVIGIHSLGIIPEMRRKGFAEEIMKQFLNYALEKGFKHVTLQSSEMGKTMYDKLGFTTQFLMSNYEIRSVD